MPPQLPRICVSHTVSGFGHVCFVHTLHFVSAKSQLQTDGCLNIISNTTDKYKFEPTTWFAWNAYESERDRERESASIWRCVRTRVRTSGCSHAFLLRAANICLILACSRVPCLCRISRERNLHTPTNHTLPANSNVHVHNTHTHTDDTIYILWISALACLHERTANFVSCLATYNNVYEKCVYLLN